MGTIQKYLKEIRDAEQKRIEAVTVDQAMVTNHVQSIIEHVADATRSKYLQQLIDLDDKATGLEVELVETKQNYDELSADFEDGQLSVAEMVDVETTLRDKVAEASRTIEQLLVVLDSITKRIGVVVEEKKKVT